MAAACLLGGGQLGRMIAAFDWRSSPLGPLEFWPQHLKTAVSLCLLSRFPTFILYGPEMIGIYNDAFLPVLGPNKHPGFLGHRFEQWWPEIWQIVQPRLESVRRERQALYLEDSFLPIERRGFLEETYFTYCYTPLCGPDGAVDGIFITLQDVSAHVLGQRRLRSLHSVATCAAGALSVEQATRSAMSALADLMAREASVSFRRGKFPSATYWHRSPPGSTHQMSHSGKVMMMMGMYSTSHCALAYQEGMRMEFIRRGRDDYPLYPIQTENLVISFHLPYRIRALY